MQYLVLDDSVFAKPDGHLYACCPQVKKPKDIERLWKGVGDGEVCVISTDTCTFTKAQKARWEGDWTRIPMGLPGLETLVPLVYTQGVLGKRIPVNRLVEKCCSNPAKIMGLYPRKGVLAAGSDADIAVFDPEKRIMVDHAQMETERRLEPVSRHVAGRIRATHILPRQADRRRLQMHRRTRLGAVAAAGKGRGNQELTTKGTKSTKKKKNFLLLCVLRALCGRFLEPSMRAGERYSLEMLRERFADVPPPLTQDEALIEATRCLYCFDAPCTRACPTHIDVPTFIRQVMHKNDIGAAKTILDANIFGGSCARACPTEVLCEGACVDNTLLRSPVQIGRLQRFATDAASAKGTKFYVAGRADGQESRGDRFRPRGADMCPRVAETRP